jgi:hypothetical protein
VYLAEILYSYLIKASAFAGEKLKPHPSAPYSPEIASLQNLENPMRVLVSAYKSKYDMTHQITEAKRKLGILGQTVPDTPKGCRDMRNLKGCRDMRNQYARELKATIKDEEMTKRRRKEHLQQLIAQHTGDAKKAAATLRRIQNVEEVQRVYQKCAVAQGKTTKGGISHILVPEHP